MGAMTTMAVDASLVRRLQQRDRLAWEELYTTYEPRLRRFAISLSGNPHDADDLVSETFVRALPALDRLDAAEVNLEAYLFATTRNLFLKQVGRTKRTEPMADVPEPVAPIVPIEDDPERSTLLGAQQIEVRAANAALQPRQRMVLALCELEERSYAEIGEMVGLNENAVAQLVFRARESLRTELRLLQVDPESLPEECRGFLPALSQYLDGQLREPRKSTMLAHLEGCERCQAALADMREAQRRYRTVLLPLSIPTGDAKARIERELEEAGYWAGGGVTGSTRSQHCGEARCRRRSCGALCRGRRRPRIGSHRRRRVRRGCVAADDHPRQDDGDRRDSGRVDVVERDDHGRRDGHHHRVVDDNDGDDRDRDRGRGHEPGHGAGQHRHDRDRAGCCPTGRDHRAAAGQGLDRARRRVLESPTADHPRDDSRLHVLLLREGDDVHVQARRAAPGRRARARPP